MIQKHNLQTICLLVQTDVRWLSNEKLLEMCITLLSDTEQILITQGQSYPAMNDVKWLAMLHFICDILTFQQSQFGTKKPTWMLRDEILFRGNSYSLEND